MKKVLASCLQFSSGMTDTLEHSPIYWHRDLPPLAAEPAGEHTVEAVSKRVPGTIAHRDDLWCVCHADLMARAEERLEQELHRLGADYAHVFDEAIEPRRDDAKGETWLVGRFSYVCYESVARRSGDRDRDGVRLVSSRARDR